MKVKAVKESLFRRNDSTHLGIKKNKKNKNRTLKKSSRISAEKQPMKLRLKVPHRCLQVCFRSAEADVTSKM